MMEPLSDEWLKALAVASQAAEVAGRPSGRVVIAVGKKRQATMSMVDGRLAVDDEAAGGSDASDGEVDVDLTLPFADDEEISDYFSGRRSLSTAYIRGDFKPVGSTGLLLPVIELVESGALADLS